MRLVGTISQLVEAPVLLAVMADSGLGCGISSVTLAAIARLQCQVPTDAAALADIDPTRLPGVDGIRRSIVQILDPDPTR